MALKFFRDANELQLPTKVVVALLAFQFAGTVVEMASLVLLLPVFQYIQAGGDLAGLVAEHRHWRWLVWGYDLIGLKPSLLLLLVTSFTFLLMRQIVTFVRLRFQAAAKEGMIARVRATAFELYLHSDADYQDKADAGGFINDLTTDLQRAADFIFGSIMLVGLLVVFTVYVASLFALSVTMTVTALVVFGLALFALRTQMKKSEATGRDVTQANQRMSGFLVERLRQSRLVRLAGTERAETAQMRALTERQRDRLVRLFTLLASIDVIIEPIVIGAAFAFIYVSTTMLDMRIEAIGLFLVIVMRLLPVLKEAARVRQSNRANFAAFQVVTNALREMENSREHRNGTVILDRLERSLNFEHVAFSYSARPDVLALAGVNLEIPARRMTAIVGPSGAGKSTLFDMIPRLRHPTVGRILLDGIDIEEFDLQSLRAGIAYAPQSPQIFNVPLIEHIRYGKPDATREEVKRAAQLANAGAFVEALPKGYDTVAGAAGGQLSGGQRQRIDLARALVGRAPILLLDEPTSNLDAESEALFRDALARIRAETDTTVIVIAHRLSTVTMADKIAVMRDGAIVAEGSHQELVRAGGWYADAFAKQGGDLTLGVAAQ